MTTHKFKKTLLMATTSMYLAIYAMTVNADQIPLVVHKMPDPTVFHFRSMKMRGAIAKDHSFIAKDHGRYCVVTPQQTRCNLWSWVYTKKGKWLFKRVVTR